MKKVLDLSVHQLVDFLLREGDIDNRIFNKTAMLEGSKIHSFYQSKQNDSYISEHPLSTTIVNQDIEINLHGRADGIIKTLKGYVIDEIKSTVSPLKDFKEKHFLWHMGQAKCYAYMFAKERKLESIGIRLTYIRQGEEKDKLIEEYSFSFLELEHYIIELIEEYLDFYNLIFNKLIKREESISTLKYPFKNYRQGQYKLIKYAYGLAKKGGTLFAEAPTGIGKTMASIFPFVKAMQGDDKAKIFYLTAKTPGRESAMHALKILKENGLFLNEIIITAKDKICFCKDKACNPEECPYARSYYNKIQNVLKYSLLNYSTFDLNTILEIAAYHEICPFEFQLDLSLFCDIIICDYNYMFDPNVYMRRYFDEDSSRFFALIDEAHNLVNRSREMYSASIKLSTLEEAKKSLRKLNEKKLKNYLRKLTNLFKEIEEQYEDGNHLLVDFTDEQYKVLSRFITNYQNYTKDIDYTLPNEVTDLFLEINLFMKISEFFNHRFIAYIKKDEEDTSMNFYCVDASKFIENRIKKVKATMFFSATMSPIEYYIDTLGGDKSLDPYIILPSPFPRSNLKLMIAPKVSVKYKNRESSYGIIAQYIKSFIKGKVGNYFIYTPSYEYLDNLLSNLDLGEEIDIFTQRRDMTDYEKVLFLENFKSEPSKTTLGFLVIGGAFSEGIDLVSDRLIGAIIIGVGMPKINFESDQISKYYKNLSQPGYEYAYLNPGMNKVMQALGRVIRDENDVGAVLLIDERYTHKNYQELFNLEGKDYEIVLSSDEVEEIVINFFKN